MVTRTKLLRGGAAFFYRALCGFIVIIINNGRRGHGVDGLAWRAEAKARGGAHCSRPGRLVGAVGAAWHGEAKPVVYQVIPGQSFLDGAGPLR
jgi:hypothetical protein